jgi:hypothetical protein
VDANALKSNWCLFHQAQSTSKIKVTLGGHRRVPQLNPDCGRDRSKPDTGARHQRLKKHVSRARQRSITARCRMQAGLDEGPSGFNLAGHTRQRTPSCVQGKVIKAESGSAFTAPLVDLGALSVVLHSYS